MFKNLGSRSRATKNWSVIDANRKKFVTAGIFPVANTQKVFEYSKLPFTNNLVDLMIVDLDAMGTDKPSEGEIMRVLGFDGEAYVKQGGSWKLLKNSFPEKADEWTHPLHGPDRRAISKDEELQPFSNGVRWMVDRKGTIPTWCRHANA